MAVSANDDAAGKNWLYMLADRWVHFNDICKYIHYA